MSLSLLIVSSDEEFCVFLILLLASVYINEVNWLSGLKNSSFLSSIY